MDAPTMLRNHRVIRLWNSLCRIYLASVILLSVGSMGLAQQSTESPVGFPASEIGVLPNTSREDAGSARASTYSSADVSRPSAPANFRPLRELTGSEIISLLQQQPEAMVEVKTLVADK